MAYLLKAKGLQTFKNELDANEGALQVANNVVIDEDGVIEPRRGFADYSITPASATLKQLMQYKGRILRHYSTKIDWDNGSGVFTQFSGAYSEVQSGIRIKYQEANGNLYFNTSNGIKKISVTDPSQFSTTNIMNAGGVKALGLIAELTVGTVNFLLTTKSVGYRVLWGIKDINENLIYGTPSSRYVITNVLGTDQAVKVKIQIPEEVTSTTYFYQIYRTSLSSTADAVSDEMQLVYEANPTSAELTAMEVQYIDETPDSFRESGDYLYTNAITGEGILQANEKPPIAKDITLFKNSMFYANTKTRHKLYLNMLLGVQNLIGYSLKITTVNGTREYKFIISTGTEQVQAYGGDVVVANTGSPSLDIDETSRSLERIMNKDPNSDVYCFYLSSEGTLPGQMMFENRELNDIKFSVSVDNAAISGQFSPEVPVFPAATLYSDNEIAPNRLYFSKFAQPEAVPSVNYIDIGPKDKAIIRIVGLRDLLYVYKEDGLYTVSGEVAPDFSASLLDGTIKLLSPDSVAVLNNRVYMLSSDGVGFAISSGTAVISRDIENLILKLMASNMNYETAVFGLASNADRSYFLFAPTLPTDTYATQCFRFNTFTETWTRWTLSSSCGLIHNEENKLYITDASRNIVVSERKNRDRTDYADRDFSVNFEDSSISGNTIKIDSLLDIEIGDVFYQNQYVTIYEFNATLRKLDLDLGLAKSSINGGAGYVNLLNMNAGENLQLKLQALDTELSTDANIGTWTTITFPADFLGMQTKFNDLIDQLNSGPCGTFLKNYLASEGTLEYEALILEIDSLKNIVTLNAMMPYINGSDGCQIFKSIKADIQWKPQHFGAPEKTKQIREATLLVDQNNFYSASVQFASDLSPYFDIIPVLGRGNGSFGSNTFGEDNFGGDGADIPFRTLVPMEKQRCRYLTVRFVHSNAREAFRVLGISAEVRAVSSRGYR